MIVNLLKAMEFRPLANQTVIPEQFVIVVMLMHLSDSEFAEAMLPFMRELATFGKDDYITAMLEWLQVCMSIKAVNIY